MDKISGTLVPKHQEFNVKESRLGKNALCEAFWLCTSSRLVSVAMWLS